jgi:ketosteroid isomerase-like protein
VHPNEKLIRDLLGGVLAPDRVGVADLQHPDLVMHFPGNNILSGDHHGPDGARAFNQVLRERSGGTIRFEVIDVLGGDEHTFLLFVASAERNGRTYSWRAVSVYRIEGGKLRETWIHPFQLDQVDAFLTD